MSFFWWPSSVKSKPMINFWGSKECMEVTLEILQNCSWKHLVTVSCCLEDGISVGSKAGSWSVSERRSVPGKAWGRSRCGTVSGTTETGPFSFLLLQGAQIVLWFHRIARTRWATHTLNLLQNDKTLKKTSTNQRKLVTRRRSVENHTFGVFFILI